ncbi:hypothetical protein ABL78_5823 [Leptomonas seymouri]|uniref:Endonuclease/exonuclease/phosphatase domain-containing protein n=1 Tax=Leptomonas seymouri TaxID=5684 RepID=A0A0N1I4A3_LEPSE|nr:hypothetical protein ABL78_5823 [Leptomonas seymouri]|eukprot:KPI85130.1 hypothetical protein ABL78_5823 [Leptomonas seymouri]
MSYVRSIRCQSLCRCYTRSTASPALRVRNRSPNPTSFARFTQTLCRCQSTSAAPPAAAPSGFAKAPPALSSLPARSPPPPLSILSWAVDGSEHTHHHCTRRLSLLQRIPLLCETIRLTAPDVVALQDSTPELAAALTAETGDLEQQQQQQRCTDGGDSEKVRLKVYCAELARELRQPLRDGDATTGGDESATPSCLSAAAELPAGGSEACASDAEKTAVSSDSHGGRLTYRLIGRARNGHCGELQLFVKATSLWDAELLPGMGAGLTMELRSRASTRSSAERAAGEQTEGPAAVPSGEGEANTGGGAESASPPPPHRCVLTTVDLSYRGKSVGTHLQGLLSNAAVSEEGSPLTLQTQESSSPSPPWRRGVRAAGQLDRHRAMLFDWVHHHLKPDVLVGNMFLGARERVPGFEDAWVRAGSPSGQERTTNTCARHRVDRMTNYFYFKPSPGLASTAVVERMMWMEAEQHEGEEATSSTTTGATASGEGDQVEVTLPAEAEATVNRNRRPHVDATTRFAAPAKTFIPAEAAVGTPLPLDAYRDEEDGAWHTQSLGDMGADHLKGGVQDPVAAPAACLSPLPLTAGVPEVAGRFQRCFFRAWVRRGPSSRGGHPSARPLLRQYKRCRVVVLRPMTEVELDAEERAWHARYTTAKHSRSAAPDETNAAAVGEEDKGMSASSRLRAVDVHSRVRCSLSDQYPLLTLLS